MKNCRPLRPGLLQPQTNSITHSSEYPVFLFYTLLGFFACFFFFFFNSKICWGKLKVLLKGDGGRVSPASLLLLTRRMKERRLHEDISSFYLRFCFYCLETGHRLFAFFEYSKTASSSQTAFKTSRQEGASVTLTWRGRESVIAVNWV